MEKRRKKLLIIVCGDSQSKHQSYWNKKLRDLADLYLIDYVGDLERTNATYYQRKSGPKWWLIHRGMQENPELLEQYQYFWCPDDDIEMSERAVIKLLDTTQEFNLALSQPAIRWGATRDHKLRANRLVQDIDFAHLCTLWQANLRLHYTDFIEQMAPMFERSAFLAALDTWGSPHALWGIDYLFCFKNRLRKMAVVDEAPMAHTRAIGSSKQYRSIDNPYEKMEKWLWEYGVKPYPPKILGSVKRRFYDPHRVWHLISSRLNKAWLMCRKAFNPFIEIRF